MKIYTLNKINSLFMEKPPTKPPEKNSNNLERTAEILKNEEITNLTNSIPFLILGEKVFNALDGGKINRGGDRYIYNKHNGATKKNTQEFLELVNTLSSHTTKANADKIALKQVLEAEKLNNESEGIQKTEEEMAKDALLRWQSRQISSRFLQESMTDAAVDLILSMQENSVKSRNGTLTEPKANRSDIIKVAKAVKTKYTMKANEAVSEVVSQATANSTVGDVLRKIELAYNNFIANSLTEAETTEKARKIFQDLKVRKVAEYYQQKMKEIVEGMRHEVGFHELVIEGSYRRDEDLIELEKSTIEQDSRGIDFYATVKVVKDTNPNSPTYNEYIYPSKEDIAANNFEEIKLPIDIKKNPKNKLIKNSSKNKTLVMWSHLYAEDFQLASSTNRLGKKRLSMNDYLDGNLFLSLDQFTAMDELYKSLPKDKEKWLLDNNSLETEFFYNNQNIETGVFNQERYNPRSEQWESGELKKSVIISVDQRYDSIKAIILEKINQNFTWEEAEKHREDKLAS